jgi:hypothetical protein
MLSRLSDVLAGLLPVVCVVAVSSLAAVVTVALLVRDVAARAIEKAAPDQVAAVVIAVAALVGPFRWLWPWSGRTCAQPVQYDQDNGVEEPSSQSAGGQA